MTSVSGGATASYAHNALGQRVKKVTGGGTTYFVYDEAGHLVGEYDGAGALIQETVWLGDIPVATLRPNGGSVAVYYVHTDHLNTPRRISRPADNVIVWRWDSDPFGTTAASQDPDGDSTNFFYHLRFPGQYYDTETGLNYNYFRDYDAQTGRYVESDPIGLEAGPNTYAYVGSDPLSFYDALGLDAQSCEAPQVNVDPDFEIYDPPIEPIRPECLLPQLRWLCGTGNSKAMASMAQNNKHTRKVIKGLMDHIRAHREKLSAKPKSADARHWQDEINAAQERVDRLQKRLPGGK